MIYADDIDFIVENDKADKPGISLTNKTFQKWTLDATCLKQKSLISKEAKMNRGDSRKNLALCWEMTKTVKEDGYSLLSRLESYQTYGKRLKERQLEEKSIFTKP